MAKRYFGVFKDINENDIHVEIVPSNNTYTESVELRFPYEEPVTIEQVSDGIFSPVKTKSATIKIFTEDIYWDLYAGSVTAYYVHIYNDDRSLFNGYLTPCIYTQDYAYKAVIELEAVDILAVTEQFDYKVTGMRDILTIDAVIEKIFDNIPQYDGYVNHSTIDFTKYKLQEANFFDDDDEPMSGKEILDELCRYLGITTTMYEGKVYFIDYGNNSSTASTLDIVKYGEGTPSVELDDVYNKVSIGANLYEVDDLIDDVFDDDNKTVINEMKMVTENSKVYCDFYWSWRQWYKHTKDNQRYMMLVKPYQFVDSSIADGRKYITSRWKTYNRKINTLTPLTVTPAQKADFDCNKYKDGNDTNVFVPQFTGAYPIRQYTYAKSEGIANKASVTWKDLILFPTLDYDHRNERRTTYPAMTFLNNNKLAYSMKGGTGYLVLNASLWYQIQAAIEGGPNDDYIVWTKVKNIASDQEEVVALPICMDNVDVELHNMPTYSRSHSASGYNTGFKCVKAMIRIGDKYWNGSAWTTTESTFYISFHDDDVVSDDETFNYWTWLKVASNPSHPPIEVGKEGYAIPITGTDGLCGDLEFTLFTPEQIPTNISATVLGGFRYAPNTFMSDLSLEYVFNNSDNWADDKKTDEDKVYWKISPNGYATEMDEIDIKINSWVDEKPISRSYMLDEDNNPVEEIDGMVQEDRLVNKYLNHYGNNPKKIFNLNYKITNVNPRAKFYHTQTNTTYVVDSYSMDVKMGETTLKLTEL